MKNLFLALIISASLPTASYAAAGLFSCNLRDRGHAACTEYRYGNDEGNEELAKQRRKCGEEGGIPGENTLCPDGQAFSCVDDAKGYTIRIYPEMGRIKIALAKRKCREKGGQVH